MRHPLPELFIAHKNADLHRETEHNRLVREAKRAKTYRRDFLSNKLLALSSWMIRTGEQLHERYHAKTKAGSY